MRLTASTARRSSRSRSRRSAPPEDVDVKEFNDGEQLVFTAEVDVRPEVTLPDLDGIELTVDDVTVTDEDVDEQLQSLRDRFATLQPVERAVADGDYLTHRPVAPPSTARSSPVRNRRGCPTRSARKT